MALNKYLLTAAVLIINTNLFAQNNYTSTQSRSLFYGAYRCTDNKSEVMRIFFRDKTFISIIKELENGKLVSRGIFTGNFDFKNNIFSMRGYGVKRGSADFQQTDPPIVNDFEVNQVGSEIEMTRVAGRSNNPSLKCVLTKNKELYENADKLKSSIPREMFNDWTNLDLSTNAYISPLLENEKKQQKTAPEIQKNSLMWQTNAGKELKSADRKVDKQVYAKIALAVLNQTISNASQSSLQCKVIADKQKFYAQEVFPRQWESTLKASKGDVNLFIWDGFTSGVIDSLEKIFSECPSSLEH